MNLLNRESVFALSNVIEKPLEKVHTADNHIMHIGVGGFHRAHQAYAIASLCNLDAVKYSNWKITGVCLMPQDKKIVENLRAQDNLYTLKMVSSKGVEKFQVIDAIKEIWHIDEDLELIIQKIAHPETRIISFTITEGGYNYDFEDQRFLLGNPTIAQDLKNKSNPKTVFGLLAKGLKHRMDDNGSALTLLSCDNIIGNGDILRKSLLSFLTEYDINLCQWVEKSVYFPNSMVDRITPVSSNKEMDDFEHRFSVRDNCLVVSEDYFQWVIESGDFENQFPPLDRVGVDFVSAVGPYEKMKLGILNGGHSLVGFLGYAFGYATIHESVLDPLIARIYTQYIQEEVIPTLEMIEDVDFNSYFLKVKARFSNAMINDSVARIQSFTSDKFPKFILPVILKQLESSLPRISCAAVVVAAWWHYLKDQVQRGSIDTIQDNARTVWKEIFSDITNSEENFLDYAPVFANLSSHKNFKLAYLDAVAAFKENSIQSYLSKF